MNKEITRRTLLRLPLAEVHARLPAATNSPPPPHGDSAARLSGSVNAWVTDSQRRVSARPSIRWEKASQPAPSSSIILYPDQKFQEILGFGAALTDAACSLLHRLSPDVRLRLFHDLFAPSEMNLNLCRICMGSSDCSTSVFSYDDGPVDPDLQHFSIAHDHEYVLPILRQARSVNPELLYFGSPWSPPGWMKSNGSPLGGCMRHTYMPSYADYVLRFLSAYEAAGVPVYAVTVQNEVDTDQDGTMPACAWPQDYEADFVTMHLGPLFQRAGMRTKIWILDHNYNLWGRAIAQLETPDVRKYIDGIAWHGYQGEPEWIERVRDEFPDAAMYWTEGGPDYQSPGYATEWARWGETFCRVLESSCRSITVWTLVSDEHGRPYVGGGTSGVGGAMLLNTKTTEISHSGMFWALRHFSRFVKRGANRVASESPSQSLRHCAFVNPDGSLVVVIPNSGEQSSCQIQVTDHVAHVPLSANSITTVVCPSADA